MVGSRMLLKGFESGLLAAVSVVVPSRAGERRAQIKETCGSRCAVESERETYVCLPIGHSKSHWIAS